MCGIAGVVFREQKVNESMLTVMTNAIEHRGHDGHGIYNYENFGIGHRRLSIIDPNGGHQPMASPDEMVWITFNGAIYNYIELRQELIQLGHNFKTHSDTEVIIHAYEEFGDKCVEKFNGMFSFVIYDKKNAEIFGARDRLGIKPFYYYADEDKFLFGSEIKAILASDLIEAEANYDGIKDYLTFQYTLGNKTLFKGINRLEPGYSIKLKLGDTLDVSVKQYWDLKFNYDTHHTSDYFEDQLKYLLADAVKIRLRSDVPLGCHLSGGLDSSAVTCLASQYSGSYGLKTFTGAFNEGEEFDETKYAKIVSKEANTKYLEVRPTAQQFQETLEQLIYYMDEPSAGPGLFPQFMVSKLASDHVKVVLGGQGGDEIFMGYARYLVGYLEECIKGAIWETNEKGKHIVSLDSIVPNLPMLQNYRPMLQYFWKDGLFGEQEDRYFRLINRSEGNENLYNQELLNKTEYTSYDGYMEYFKKDDLDSYVNKMMYFDIKASLPALLHGEDRTSMACGLESRLPLLDYRIIELLATIPPAMKFGGGESKLMFKKVIKNIIPAEIYNRTDKKGFPMPINQWFKNDMKEYIDGILLSERTAERGLFNMEEVKKQLEGSGKYSRVVWGMLCLELWFREFIDK